MRKLLLPILLVIATTGCTAGEVERWLAWWEDDPNAAVEYANQDWVQRSLEWGCTGYCDVDDPDVVGEGGGDSSRDSSDGWTDETVTEDESTDAGVGVYWPWDALAQCESGGDWGINTGNGYYGGLQFALGSWEAAGGSGYPHEASAAEQVHRGEILQDMQGWNAWPTCARQIGLL